MTTTEPVKPLATIRGTMLVPGVSRNNRLYTRETIARAVNRMKARLSDPDGLPVVMRTHHDAGDNSRLIVGRVTDVTQLPDGSATYEAKLYNTEAGRDIGALIDPNGPALRSTSIHGYWIGPVETHRQNGGMVESGSDLEVNAIDFTGAPGVPGARISAVTFESAPPPDGRVITESMEATITVDEVSDGIEAHLAAIREKYTAAQQRQMLAKGQAMPNAKGEPSYTIKTKGDLRKAIKAVGRGGADHDDIRKHIAQRAKALGLTGMLPPNWNPDGSLKEAETPTPATVEETYVVVCVGDDTGPLVKVCAANVTPDTVMKAAKKAAKLAAQVLDAGPDDDTDADGFQMQVGPDDGTDSTTTYDMDMDDESHNPEGGMAETWTISVGGKDLPAEQVAAIVAETRTLSTPQTPAAPAADNAPAMAEANEKEVAVGDAAKVAEQATTTPATPDLAGIIAATVAETVKATMQAMRKEAKDAKRVKATSETTDTGTTATAESTQKAGKKGPKATSSTGITPAQLQEALAAERAKTVNEVREQLLREGGLPQRKGYRHVNETDEGADRLTGDDLWNKRSEVWDQFFPDTAALAAAAADTAA